MFFISPPFGNYLYVPNMTRIYGSFTLEPRDGLWLQVIKTLRYIPKYRGWINKIGLRNKGIDWALKNVPEEHVISVAIMNESDIPLLLKKIPNERSIEINISCPNVIKSGNIDNLTGFLNNKRKWCILKLSPKVSLNQMDLYYKIGFRQFHCSNTIQIPEGGLSGIAVQPHTIDNIMYLKTKYSDVEVIAGGGIKTWKNVEMYKVHGADHYSISTGWFSPFHIIPFLVRYAMHNSNI